MGVRPEAAPSSPEETTQRLARMLRHEVGDLLQSIYSAEAILLERLPAERTLERRMVSDLKQRAELCKFELDAVVDLVSPLEVTAGRVELIGLVSGVVGQARRRYPALSVYLEAAGAAFVAADARALAKALTLLLLALCQSAKQQVRVQVQIGSTEVSCALERDGYDVAAEQLGWLERPFATTQYALFGLGLAQTQRIAQGHGGFVQAAQRAQGGVCVRLVLPLVADV